MNYLPEQTFAIQIPDQETNRKVQQKFFDLGARWRSGGRLFINPPVSEHGGNGAIRYWPETNVISYCSVTHFLRELIPFVHADIFLYECGQVMMITPRRCNEINV